MAGLLSLVVLLVATAAADLYDSDYPAYPTGSGASDYPVKAYPTGSGASDYPVKAYPTGSGTKKSQVPLYGSDADVSRVTSEVSTYDAKKSNLSTADESKVDYSKVEVSGGYDSDYPEDYSSEAAYSSGSNQVAVDKPLLRESSSPYDVNGGEDYDTVDNYQLRRRAFDGDYFDDYPVPSFPSYTPDDEEEGYTPDAKQGYSPDQKQGAFEGKLPFLGGGANGGKGGLLPKLPYQSDEPSYQTQGDYPGFGNYPGANKGGQTAPGGKSQGQKAGKSQGSGKDVKLDSGKGY